MMAFGALLVMSGRLNAGFEGADDRLDKINGTLDKIKETLDEACIFMGRV